MGEMACLGKKCRDLGTIASQKCVKRAMISRITEVLKHIRLDPDF